MTDTKGKAVLTDYQKEQVKALRTQGLGYRKIANQLGIQRDSVRNYCNSVKTGKTRGVTKIHEKENVCRFCKAPLIQTGRGRKKQYCDGQCRYQWYKKNAEEHYDLSEAYYEVTCKGCGEKFMVYGNRKRLYCSHHCYVSHRFWGGNKTVQSLAVDMETATPTVIMLDYHK